MRGMCSNSRMLLPLTKEILPIMGTAADTGSISSTGIRSALALDLLVFFFVDLVAGASSKSSTIVLFVFFLEDFLATGFASSSDSSSHLFAFFFFEIDFFLGETFLARLLLVAAS